MSNPLLQHLGLARPALESEQAVADAAYNSQNPIPAPVELGEEQIVEIAKQAHETNRGYCEKLGDGSQLSWDDAPEAIRQSAIDGVKNIIANPGVTPKQSHDNWLKFKQTDGWTYGPEKDEAKKEHPCMVPYEELPEHEKVKDQLFTDTVQALVAEQTQTPVEIEAVATEELREELALLSNYCSGMNPLSALSENLETHPEQFNSTNAQLATVVTERITDFKQGGLLLSAEAYGGDKRAIAVEFTSSTLKNKLAAFFETIAQLLRNLMNKLYELVIRLRNKARKERAMLAIVQRRLNSLDKSVNKNATLRIDATNQLLGATSPAEVGGTTLTVDNTPKLFSAVVARCGDVFRFVSSFVNEESNGTTELSKDQKLSALSTKLAHLQGVFHQGEMKDEPGLILNPKALGWMEAGIKIGAYPSFYRATVPSNDKAYTVMTLKLDDAKRFVTALYNQLSLVETELSAAERTISHLKKMEVSFTLKSKKLSRGYYSDELAPSRAQDVEDLMQNARLAARLAALSVNTVDFLRALEGRVVGGAVSVVNNSISVWKENKQLQPAAA